MKKFNLLLLATLVAFVALFFSCSKDSANSIANPPVLSFNTSSNAFDTGDSVHLNIQINMGDNKINRVEVKEGTSYITDVNNLVWNGASANSSAGFYNNTSNVVKDFVAIKPAAGTHVYTAIAYDKEGNASTAQTITIVVGALPEVANPNIFCTIAGGGTTSTCASADGTVYDPAVANSAQQLKIDFVYFSGNGTTPYGPAASIYAPSAVPSGLSILFSNWTTKNATLLAKTNLSYASATFAQVYNEAKTLTTNSVSKLVAGDVVIFKTASGKVGIFTVDLVSGTSNATDFISISLATQS